MKQDIFSEVESQYVMRKTKINDLLNEEPSAELVDKKTCCHNEYRFTDMPKIMLSKFDGNLNDWKDFRDMFIAVIYDDKTMPLVKKMHSKIILRAKQPGLSIGFHEMLKVMNRHDYSFLSILIIRNDDSKITCTASSRSSHLVKHWQRISMPQ